MFVRFANKPALSPSLRRSSNQRDFGRIRFGPVCSNVSFVFAVARSSSFAIHILMALTNALTFSMFHFVSQHWPQKIYVCRSLNSSLPKQQQQQQHQQKQHQFRFAYVPEKESCFGVIIRVIAITFSALLCREFDA